MHQVECCTLLSLKEAAQYVELRYHSTFESLKTLMHLLLICIIFSTVGCNQESNTNVFSEELCPISSNSSTSTDNSSMVSGYGGYLIGQQLKDQSESNFTITITDTFTMNRRNVFEYMLIDDSIVAVFSIVIYTTDPQSEDENDIMSTIEGITLEYEDCQSNDGTALNGSCIETVKDACIYDILTRFPDSMIVTNQSDDDRVSLRLQDEQGAILAFVYSHADEADNGTLLIIIKSDKLMQAYSND